MDTRKTGAQDRVFGLLLKSLGYSEVDILRTDEYSCEVTIPPTNFLDFHKKLVGSPYNSRLVHFGKNTQFLFDKVMIPSQPDLLRIAVVFPLRGVLIEKAKMRVFGVWSYSEMGSLSYTDVSGNHSSLR